MVIPIVLVEVTTVKPLWTSPIGERLLVCLFENSAVPRDQQNAIQIDGRVHRLKWFEFSVLSAHKPIRRERTVNIARHWTPSATSYRVFSSNAEKPKHRKGELFYEYEP